MNAEDLNCYAADQATKYSLSKRYGVECNLEAFLTEARKAATMTILTDLSACGAYNETISCFLRGKKVDPCSPITIKDCDGEIVAFVEPTAKPCFLTATFL